MFRGLLSPPKILLLEPIMLVREHLDNVVFNIALIKQHFLRCISKSMTPRHGV